jgi:hypothetical protein
MGEFAILAFPAHTAAACVRCSMPLTEHRSMLCPATQTRRYRLKVCQELSNSRQLCRYRAARLSLQQVGSCYLTTYRRPWVALRTPTHIMIGWTARILIQTEAGSYVSQHHNDMKGHVHAIHAQFFFLWCWIFQQLLSRPKRVSLTRARNIDTVSNTQNPAFWGRNSIATARNLTLRSKPLAQIAMNDKIQSLFQATMPKMEHHPTRASSKLRKPCNDCVSFTF